MNYKVLYRKYRPNNFDLLVGQDNLIKILKTTIIEKKVSHAYIFTGPRGTGKTSTARIFAKAINCLNPQNGNPCNECDNCKIFEENPDIIEIDAASNNGVDEIRELINNVRLSPSMSKYKVYIIDEFHMLSTSAFNALLLTLEDPPSNVVFILATTDIQNVPITILSRCQRFDFKLISKKEIIERLSFICKKEKINIDDSAINEIAYLSNGGMRDALSILDQISALDNQITVDDVNKMFGSISNKNVESLLEELEKGNALQIDELIKNFKDSGINYTILINKIINYLKNIMINIKENKYNGSFNFDDLYNIIIDLSSYNQKGTIDSYTYLEITLLKNIRQIDLNVDNQMCLLKDTDTKPKENICKTMDIETEMLTSKTNECTINKEVRINNCFVNAKKNYLNDIKKKWNDFISYESNANKKLMSIIVDTELVAISDAYGIIINDYESTVTLINDNIKTFESDFKNFYGQSIKFIALDNKDWEITKNNYINNLKNNIKYSIINEDQNDQKVQQSGNNKLEVLANEIFGNNVEIK